MTKAAFDKIAAGLNDAIGAGDVGELVERLFQASDRSSYNAERGCIYSQRDANTLEQAADTLQRYAAALAPLARYADLNDLAHRDADDAIEVPIRDLLAARAALGQTSRTSAARSPE